ncbi:hypothetical protein FHG87_015726 [Trinorchestia longiramus]|nr:hypothetical protein FHG87_015726 [Trinorchestia longiramus]
MRVELDHCMSNNSSSGGNNNKSTSNNRSSGNNSKSNNNSNNNRRSGSAPLKLLCVWRIAATTESVNLCRSAHRFHRPAQVCSPSSQACTGLFTVLARLRRSFHRPRRPAQVYSEPP